jgi:hypothetical protein
MQAIGVRARIGNQLLAGFYVALLAFGFQIGHRNGLTACLGAIAVLGFCGWITNYRRHLRVADTPTSKIVAAAQGYVELSGTARLLAGTPVINPLTGLPCCWYRYYLEVRSGDEWRHDESGVSDDCFALDDGTGQCVIDPAGAEVLSTHRKRWTEGDHRYTEWTLLPDEPLYALGEFGTRRGNDQAPDETAALGALLAEWKKDRPTLLKRFDLDQNGDIDMKEWALARAAARRQLEREMMNARTLPGVNILNKPHDGSLFVLSNRDPASLDRRYFRWSLLHLAVLLCASGIAGWLVA